MAEEELVLTVDTEQMDSEEDKAFTKKILAKMLKVNG